MSDSKDYLPHKRWLFHLCTGAAHECVSVMSLDPCKDSMTSHCPMRSFALSCSDDFETKFSLALASDESAMRDVHVRVLTSIFVV